VTRWWPSRSGVKIGTKKYVPETIKNQPNPIIALKALDQKLNP